MRAVGSLWTINEWPVPVYKLLKSIMWPDLPEIFRVSLNFGNVTNTQHEGNSVSFQRKVTLDWCGTGGPWLCCASITNESRTDVCSVWTPERMINIMKTYCVPDLCLTNSLSTVCKVTNRYSHSLFMKLFMKLAIYLVIYILIYSFI